MLALTALLLIACHRPEAATDAAAKPTPQSASAPQAHDEIAWIHGEVAQAFELARTQHKPVLLYWGAVWCPPCHQLKATVFARPDFIAKTRLFVTVYLDGDESSAQKWAEEFRVQGYPTLVILSEDKREVMRLSGGMDLSQYANVLDVALADLQPVDSTLTNFATAPTPATCTRLAFNAWTLDDLHEQEFAARAKQLALAAQRCAVIEPLASARLAGFAGYFQAAADSQLITHEHRLSAAMRSSIAGVDKALQEHGTDPRLSDVLQSLNTTFFTAVKLAGNNTARTFNERYRAAMDSEALDSNLAEADRLAALGSKLVVSRVLSKDGTWPPSDVVAIRARIDAVLKQKQSSYERSSILNSVLNIYDELKLHQAAYDLVVAELPQTEHRFYLEADMAEIAEELGRHDEAVKLWAQAYNDAQGAATRFQWGESYASALMRLQPQDTQRIVGVVTQALTELDGPDRIYRRARLRLQRLDRELREWNRASHNAHDDELMTLRVHMQRICTKIPTNESARSSCDSFLATT